MKSAQIQHQPTPVTLANLNERQWFEVPRPSLVLTNTDLIFVIELMTSENIFRNVFGNAMKTLRLHSNGTGLVVK